VATTEDILFRNLIVKPLVFAELVGRLNPTFEEAVERIHKAGFFGLYSPVRPYVGSVLAFPPNPRDGSVLIDHDVREIHYYTASVWIKIVPVHWYGTQNVFRDLLVADTNHIIVAEALNVGTPITCVMAAQTDVPRNVSITVTDGDTSISAFQIDVVGIDAKGGAAAERFVFGGGLVQTGNVIWAHITSIIVTSITGAGAGDVLDVGVGSKVGVSTHLRSVYKIQKNNTHMSSADYTVDTAHDSIDLSVGGAIAGGDDYTVWYNI